MLSSAQGVPSGSFRKRSKLRSRSTQLLALRFGWSVLVIWYEVGEFFFSLSGCRFPDAKFRQESSEVPTHIVLIADPHVPHPILSHSPDEARWTNTFRQGMEELFMRKSWNVVQRLGRIDAVIFVGDMLDQGRAIMSDASYDEYYNLFRSIFRLPSSTPMYYVPGNHDIPLAATGKMFDANARRRYADHFGRSNGILRVANHSIILLDAIGLVEEDYRRYYAEMQFGEWEGIKSGVIEFVQALGRNPPQSPILISHIPLSRKATSQCGPLRESREPIKKGVGLGYQNLLGRETSKFLLEAIQPTVVFSGDDHDYCDVTHPNGVQEVTIKTFSSDQGVRRPGFQLMSLIPPTENSSGQANVPCLLPDQIGVYTRIYIPLAILTFGFLLFTNIRKAWSRSVDKNKEDHHHHPLSSEKQPSQISIPSRRSSQHLQGLSSARERHLSALSPHASAPPSPIHTPLAGHSPFIGYDNSDPELGIEHTASPPRSLRGSYTDFSQIGGGSSRHNSTNLVPPLQAAAHRVSLPRMRSTADWASAARAKDMSVLSLVTDRRRPALAYIRALAGWLWRTRKSVLVTSWWEAVSIAIPALAVWIIMNALFFHQ